jgi:hypothetical protein
MCFVVFVGYTIDTGTGLLPGCPGQGSASGRRGRRCRGRRRASLTEGTRYIRGKTILVVDDDPDLLQLMTHVFGRSDAQVMTAPSGREGLRQFRVHAPDLMLLDLMIPEMDGWQLIILTAPDQSQDMIKGLEADTRRPAYLLNERGVGYRFEKKTPLSDPNAVRIRRADH